MRMNTDIVLEYIEAINSHDIEGIVNLMSKDHTFIDSGGIEAKGIKRMRTGWTEYFEMCPDYTIAIEELLEKENIIALFGRTKGTYNLEKKPGKGIFWECTAAWKVVVEKGKIKIWQVFADWSSFHELLNKNK